MVKNIWTDKEATAKIIDQVRNDRILQLEEAVDEALTYLECLMGSDYAESETIQRIEALLNGGKQ